MKRIYYGLLGIIIVIGLTLYFDDYFPLTSADIQEIHSYQEIAQEMRTWSKDTLVLFDVDYTLIEPLDSLGNAYRWPLSFWLRVLWHHPSFIKRSVWKKYNSIMWGNAERALVESEVPTMITTLKQQGCVVMGLTGVDADDYGLIKSVPEWRSTMLAKLGITFSTQCGNFFLHTLPERNGTPPYVYNGIIFADYESKNLVLAEFLDHCNLHPNHIVIFDNARRTLYKLGATCQGLHIAHTLYRYNGSSHAFDYNNADQLLERIDAIVKCECWVE